MTWALFESSWDPSAKFPGKGSRPASRARGFAPVSHRDGRTNRAIRDLFESSRIINVFDELHYFTHSATDVYDDYIRGMRTRFDPKPVDESNVERVTRCRAKIETFYSKLADLLIEGAAS